MVPTLQRVLEKHATYPVRSKIIEFLYRYDSETYTSLINHVPDLLYRVSYLEDQWDKVEQLYDEDFDLFYVISDRFEETVDDCSEETVDAFIESMKHWK